MLSIFRMKKHAAAAPLAATEPTNTIAASANTAANSDHAPLEYAPAEVIQSIKPSTQPPRDLPVAAHSLKVRSSKALSLLKEKTSEFKGCVWAETGDRDALFAMVSSNWELEKIQGQLTRLGLECETDVSMNKISMLKVPLTHHNLDKIGLSMTTEGPQHTQAAPLDHTPATQQNASPSTPSMQVTAVNRGATVEQESHAASIY